MRSPGSRRRGSVAGDPRAARSVHDRRGRRHAPARARSDGRGDADGRIGHARASPRPTSSNGPRPPAGPPVRRDVIRAADAQEADWLRQARRAAHYALERLGEVRMEDVGVPRSRVPDMLRAIEAIAAKHDVRIGTFGHAGDGNLHPDLVFERGDPRAETMTKLVQARPVPRRARRSAARSPASTASAWPAATGSRSSAAPTRCGSCGRSRRRSTRWASSTRGASSDGSPVMSSAEGGPRRTPRS